MKDKRAVSYSGKHRFEGVPVWKAEIITKGEPVVRALKLIESEDVPKNVAECISARKYSVPDVEYIYRVMYAHRFSYHVYSSQKYWYADAIVFLIWLFRPICKYKETMDFFGYYGRDRALFDDAMNNAFSDNPNYMYNHEIWGLWSPVWDKLVAAGKIFFDEEGFANVHYKDVQRAINLYRENGYPWKGADLDWLEEEVKAGRAMEALGVEESQIFPLNPPPDWKKILLFELKLGHVLPRGLVQILKNDGKLGKRNWVAGPWHPENGMAIEILRPCDFANESREVRKEAAGRRGVLPFATGEDGEHECLAINYWRPGVPRGAVVYLDSEGDFPVTMVARNFNEFLGMLQEDPYEGRDLTEEEELAMVWVDPAERASVRVARPIPGFPDPRDKHEEW